MKKGTELDLHIESLAYGGQGVARADDFVVFVRNAIPGQSVRARVIRKKKSYAEASVLSVLKESDHTVKPRCTHFGHCGGCAFQNLKYEEQIKQKGQQVRDILQRIGHLNEFKINNTISSPLLFQYRNKMEFSFSRIRWLSPEEIDSGKLIDREGLFLGLHAKGFYDKVIDLQECHLTSPIAAEVLKTVRKFARQSGLPAYSTRDHQGFWRFLIIRPSLNINDLMVAVVTSEYRPELMSSLAAELTRAFPQITSLINGITSSKSSVAFSERDVLLSGSPVIAEKLDAFEFQISSNSFFQTNTKAAKVLYDIALDYAEFNGDENVYDLYCGAGSISIYASSGVKHITGFESVESAVENARQNCRLNNVTNCTFVHCDLKYALQDTQHIINTYGQPDVIILDPPRGGMHPKTVEAVLKLRPRRIVHVSCNPTTLARELSVLCKEHYRLNKVQPVDMFPHTPHIEVVAQLDLVTG